MSFLQSLIETLPLLLDGLWITIQICSLAAVMSLALAVPLVAGRRSNSRIANTAVKTYVSLIRGLPVVIVVFLMYFGLPNALDLGRVSAFWVGVIALSLNGAAFVSEVLRAAIESIHRGQWEASMSLGLTRFQMWLKVIVPQVIPVATPALMGELTFLVKASPVLSLITVVDLTRRAQQVSMQNFDPLTPMIAAAILYYVLLFTLTFLSSYIERQLDTPGHTK